METPSQPELPERVYAEAVVRSRTGASLLDADIPVTCETVDRFLAHADDVQAAAVELDRAGFDIIDSGNLSITVAASPATFQRALDTQLEATERPVIKELGQTTTATFINAIDQTPFGQIDLSQTRFSRLLAGIAINEPVYYFQAAPSPYPPDTGQDYLSVPDGIVEGVNAVAPQAQGLTGQGVTVAMVDSGWFPHPYFQSRRCNVTVVVAPGSTDKATDLSGHGTGVSANLLAIAPDIELIMVKADVAISGVAKNVNSISALRKAVDLSPDIISCSWGADQRRRQLSPHNRVLGAVVADAVRRGITVVFSAGNGQYGFPAQHPDAIAVGGVYRYLSGTLQGTLEASNYSSSFTSPVYPGRQVPDVCGLVGKLPYGSYIMLPVPPGSGIDQRLAFLKDGTDAKDGWAAFSGTSAAAPQVAGVCALLKQARPNLTPAQIKQVLQQSAIDVSSGYSNPSSSGAAARDGPDMATGYGLVDARRIISWIGEDKNQLFAREMIVQQKYIPDSISTSYRSTAMSSYLPQFQKKRDYILWQLERKLQELVQENNLEDIELSINELNFVPRSSLAKSAYQLRLALDQCWDCTTESIKSIDDIGEAHIFAAQGLIKLGKYSDVAIQVLTQILALDLDVESRDTLRNGDDEQRKLAVAKQDKLNSLRKVAIEALSNCGTEISLMETDPTFDLAGGICCENGLRGVEDSEGKCVIQKPHVKCPW